MIKAKYFLWGGALSLIVLLLVQHIVLNGLGYGNKSYIFNTYTFSANILADYEGNNILNNIVDDMNYATGDLKYQIDTFDGLSDITDATFSFFRIILYSLKSVFMFFYWLFYNIYYLITWFASSLFTA